MKTYLFVAILVLGCCGDKGYALAVIDSSNLAQNIISASEALTQTQNQIQQI